MLDMLKTIFADARFQTILTPKVKDGAGALQILLYQNLFLMLFSLVFPSSILVGIAAGVLFYRLGRSRNEKSAGGTIIALLFALGGGLSYWGLLQLQQSLALASNMADYWERMPFPGWAQTVVGGVCVAVGLASLVWFSTGLILILSPKKKGVWSKYFFAMRKNLIATGPVDRDSFVFGAAVLRWVVASIVIAAGVLLTLLNPGGELFENGAIAKMISVFILSAVVMFLALIVFPAWVSLLFRRVRSAGGSLPLAFLALFAGLAVALTHPVPLMIVQGQTMRFCAGDTGSILAYQYIVWPAIGSVGYLIRVAGVLVLLYVYLYPEKRRA